MTDIKPLHCDYPQCFGSECAWECERNDKHEEWVKYCIEYQKGLQLPGHDETMANLDALKVRR